MSLSCCGSVQILRNGAAAGALNQSVASRCSMYRSKPRSLLAFYGASPRALQYSDSRLDAYKPEGPLSWLLDQRSKENAGMRPMEYFFPCVQLTAQEVMPGLL
jgi:hypothetical protein